VWSKDRRQLSRSGFALSDRRRLTAPAVLRYAAPLALFALLLSACTSTTNPGPSATSGVVPQRAPITLAGVPMASCDGVAAVCGKLRVAEDPTNPAGRQIDVRVMVHPAVALSPEPDPVFFLAGGPGGAATEDLRWATAIFSTLHADRDFVMVDQRGTGGSNRLVAPAPPDTTGLSQAEAIAKVESWVKAALAELPGDPRFYTTAVAMDDVDLVRQALGYEKINLYGASYGATAAQYYMRQHGDHVRAVVLDGGTLLDVPIFEMIPANSQHALDVLFARCDADPSCDQAFPNLRGEFDSLMRDLQVRPVTTGVRDGASGQPIVFDVETFSEVIHAGLRGDWPTSDVPSLVHAAYGGDWDALARILASAIAHSGDSGSLVMSAVIRCSEAWARFDPAEVARLGFGSYYLAATIRDATNLSETCRYVPSGVVPANDGEPARGDTPVLIILGGADPQDPAANVADAPVELPRSTTVVVPGQGHTVGHRGCMPTIVAAFFKAGTVDGLDISCAATALPLPFKITAP
jgi:pimeloyl-ACP methyl ester carboxylesterase